ncbi:dipeptidase [Neptunicella marina]|uniref:Membrane dipeptidase n=1 Tax=Neptunicella marina TaxID=2125989 RepID=A0A8J6LYT1_9ALTE|nr:membrane dipeptidase [Neptunicella marina]MBC3765620.1 membrane dipeptidase [Neptunicella marina]
MTIKHKYNPQRRHWLKQGLAAAITAPMLSLGSFKVFADSETRYSNRVIELVNSTQVIDMLSLVNPIGQMMAAASDKHPKQQDAFRISPDYLQSLLNSGVDVFHPAMGLSAEDSLSFVAGLNSLVAQYAQHIIRIDSMADFERLQKGKRLGLIIGIQNADHFRSPDDVDMFYHLGQRVSQLTYNSQNLIGSGSTDRVDGGLSDFGCQIVERMNQLGMVVDVSHCGDKTTLDAFDISKKPVVITHSNVRALAGGHVRCKSDDAIRAVGKANSVMGITGVRQFVSDKEPTNIKSLIEHINYVSKMIGVEHVGIGSDMDLDGYDDIPQPYYDALKANYKASYAFRGKIDTDGFDHPKKVFDLTAGLVGAGYSDDDIRLILGGNFKRVLADIWAG